MGYNVKYDKQLDDDVVLAEVNKNTGEIKEVKRRKNNIPKGKSVHNSNFTKLNCDAITKLHQSKILSNEEVGIVTYMASIAKFNNNSLEPLNNKTKQIELSDKFNIGKNRVKSVFERLFTLGVYLQIKIYDSKGQNEYWVLNPYISWKGKLQNDSIFSHFNDCPVTKLVV